MSRPSVPYALAAGLLLLIFQLKCSDAAWCSCSTTEDPVCGWDLQTYRNECVATKCVKVGIRNKGRCPDTCAGTFSRKDCNCGATSSPVCARGQTYQNACAAECAGYGPDCYYAGVCKYPGGGSVISDVPAGPSKKFFQQSVPSTLPGKGENKYNYAEALHMNYLFYESMRSGRLSSRNRIAWRGTSCTKCRGLYNEDLSGGYYEAGGSYLKMTQVIAYTTAMLGWAVDAGRAGFKKSGELRVALEAIKWGTDYLRKGHVRQDVMVAQVGHRCRDFTFFGPPELYDKYVPGQWYGDNKYGNKDVAYVSPSDPGSEIAAMSAAALIIAAKVFRSSRVAPFNRSSTYRPLVAHAGQLYDLATAHPGSFAKSKNRIIQENHKILWGSPGYKDDLAFAAAWMYAYTREARYLSDARKYYAETPAEQGIAGGYPGYVFDGKSMYPALHFLLARLDPANKGQYLDMSARFLDQYTGGGIPTTDRGLVYPFAWGALRVSANAAFLALYHAANRDVPDAARAKYFRFGQHQIDYMLGDSGRSYVIGFGQNNPKYMWHKMSVFPINKPQVWSMAKNLRMTSVPGPFTQRTCGLPMPYNASEAEYVFRSNSFGQNVTVYGALYGSPLMNEQIVFGRDYSQAEPTVDGNAGLTGALALLTQYYSNIKPVNDCGYDLGFGRLGTPRCWK